jgi:hypothetical protein
MLFVDVDRGREDGIALASTLEQLARERDGYGNNIDDLQGTEEYSYQRS